MKDLSTRPRLPSQWYLMLVYAAVLVPLRLGLHVGGYRVLPFEGVMISLGCASVTIAGFLFVHRIRLMRWERS
jgi:hypothetical protein